MVLKMEKRGESSPTLAVAASLESVGEVIGGSGSLLCLWAKISTGPWMVHSSVIEKITVLAVKMVQKRKQGGILTCAHGHCFS